MSNAYAAVASDHGYASYTNISSNEDKEKNFSVKDYLALTMVAGIAALGSIAGSQSVSVNTPLRNQTVLVGSFGKEESLASSAFNLFNLKNTEVANDFKTAGDLAALGKQLGFSNVKWAKALSVSRDSVQKWHSTPSMNPTQQTIERSNIFFNLAGHMKPEHKPFLAKFCMGLLEIDEISRAVFAADTTADELKALYDKYYLKFDGAYKRTLIV